MTRFSIQISTTRSTKGGVPQVPLDSGKPVYPIKHGAYFSRLLFFSDPYHLAFLKLLLLALLLSAVSIIVPMSLSLLQTALRPQLGQ